MDENQVGCWTGVRAWLESVDSDLCPHCGGDGCGNCANENPTHQNKKTGTELIAEERERQINVEGYNSAHDDEHANGELRAAADCYAEIAIRPPKGLAKNWECPADWPWDRQWWKPKYNPIRNIVIAGALRLAESSRLKRLGCEEEAWNAEMSAQSCADLIDCMILERSNWASSTRGFRRLHQREILMAGDIWKAYRFFKNFIPIPTEWHGKTKGKVVSCRCEIRRPNDKLGPNTKI